MSTAYPVKKFYTITPRMSEVFAREKRQSGWRADNPEQFEAWRREARSTLRQVAGIDKLEACELLPELLESEQLDGYRRDKVIIQTEPDVWMPMFILVPDGTVPGSDRRPAFIVPHGHGSGGKYGTAGADEIPPIRERLARFGGRTPFAVQLVREGYIVFCPDARGAGERREWMRQSESDEDFTGNTCREINHMAISLGRSLAGMMAWDLMRLTDYIGTRDDCDPARIGCGGMSGGGMQTLWLAALDDRIRCAVVSGYFYGFHDSLLKLPHNCGCNFVPNLWRHFDAADFAALIAPRPLLIESGTSDPLNGENGLSNVYPQVESARAAYRLLGEEDRLVHHVFEGGHQWNGEPVPAFIARWL
ncbi:alpha/beta hydrolase family protein [Paenibacillus humicola]|uniref:alpha/beta hydrolase family protein n=1 Tax=Paenibacillus humicola TaxID=3110540 RepID=UPI00237AC633|nr:alpha/beta hydrolase family protein [Paenibacillus humicola]